MDKQKLEQLLDVQLIDAHDNWKCLCPVHDEKTPSFFIHKSTYMYHCFGCGARGYIDSLVSRTKGILPSKVREILNITPEQIGFREGHREFIRPNNFPESWLGAWPKIIHPSILKRGFTTDILKEAQVRYDKATKRQVFPHYHEGNLIGAAGRTCCGEDPKWFFYWGYRKSQALFSLPKTVGENETLYVVEGILDVLWLRQHNLYAVALLGSKASSQQIKQIKSISSSIVLALDNDEAGEIGANQLHDALKNSCSIKYANFPEYANDVCDLHGEELHETLVANTQTKLERIMKCYN